MQNENQYICKYTLLNNCIDKDIKNIINDNIISCIEEISHQLPEHNINTIFNVEDFTRNKIYSLSHNVNEAKKCSLILNNVMKELSELIKKELNIDFLISGEMHIFQTTDITDYNDIDNNELIPLKKEKYVLNSQGFINQFTNEKINPTIILENEDLLLNDNLEPILEKNTELVELNEDKKPEQRIERFKRFSQRAKNTDNNTENNQ